MSTLPSTTCVLYVRIVDTMREDCDPKGTEYVQDVIEHVASTTCVVDKMRNYVPYVHNNNMYIYR